MSVCVLSLVDIYAVRKRVAWHMTSGEVAMLGKRALCILIYFYIFLLNIFSYLILLLYLLLRTIAFVLPIFCLLLYFRRAAVPVYEMASCVTFHLASG